MLGVTVEESREIQSVIALLYESIYENFEVRFMLFERVFINVQQFSQ